MEKEAVAALVTELMPLARLLTPNIPEAETLTGLEIADEADMREAAAMIRAMGAQAVLIKGGHLNNESERYAVDLLDFEDDVKVLSGEWIESPPVRGTGCILSSAVAACLARGMSLEESVVAGKEFVAQTIRQEAGLTQRIASDSGNTAGR
jgi:hydroxymethylpyrimidine kinase/phosphomethylpyrimidine kinase